MLARKAEHRMRTPAGTRTPGLPQGTAGRLGAGREAGRARQRGAQASEAVPTLAGHSERATPLAPSPLKFSPAVKSRVKALKYCRGRGDTAGPVSSSTAPPSRGRAPWRPPGRLPEALRQVHRGGGAAPLRARFSRHPTQRGHPSDTETSGESDRHRRTSPSRRENLLLKLKTFSVKRHRCERGEAPPPLTSENSVAAAQRRLEVGHGQTCRWRCDTGPHGPTGARSGADKSRRERGGRPAGEGGEAPSELPLFRAAAPSVTGSCAGVRPHAHPGHGSPPCGFLGPPPPSGTGCSGGRAGRRAAVGHAGTRAARHGAHTTATARGPRVAVGEHRAERPQTRSPPPAG